MTASTRADSTGPTIAVVPVRMDSQRLPGKVMRSIHGKPVLGHLLDRLEKCGNLDGIVVATSTKGTNDPVDAYCATRGTVCFRGDESDVLGRLLGALQTQNAVTGVLVFGDTPLIDPEIVDGAVDFFFTSDETFDFVGNDLKTTYPPGMETEVFRVSALEDAAERTHDPAVREHGTLFIRQNPELYRVFNIEAPARHHRPELEIELDTEEDLSVISAILDQFRNRSHFGLDDMIAFLDEHPDIAARNQTIPRRWKSYRQEAE